MSKSVLLVHSDSRVQQDVRALLAGNGFRLAQIREFSLADLCKCCTVQAETIIEMVEEGMLSPTGESPSEWRFKGSAQISADWSAGFLLEMGLRQTGDSSGANQFTSADE